MKYRVVIHPGLALSCKKIRAKNPVQYEQLKRKVRTLAGNPESGKPLHPPLKGLWRVHIGHFVLIYAIDRSEETILFLRLAHHDEAYFTQDAGFRTGLLCSWREKTHAPSPSHASRCNGTPAPVSKNSVRVLLIIVVLMNHN
jgi:addiction module RelE/StbE family toxin